MSAAVTRKKETDMTQGSIVRHLVSFAFPLLLGNLFLRWITPFYLLSCANQIYSSALRGSGNTRAPMIIMLASFVVFRQVYLFVMANFISNEILPIAMGYPAGWLLCSLLTYTYYKKTDLSNSSIV